ncbi:hypothetical protein ACFX2G_035770 [Malus domestica]
MRSGASVQTIKKFNGGSNKKAGTVVSVKKLEEVGESEGGGSGAKDRGCGEVEYEVERGNERLNLEIVEERGMGCGEGEGMGYAVCMNGVQTARLQRPLNHPL